MALGSNVVLNLDQVVQLDKSVYMSVSNVNILNSCWPGLLTLYSVSRQ